MSRKAVRVLRIETVAEAAAALLKKVLRFTFVSMMPPFLIISCI